MIMLNYSLIHSFLLLQIMFNPRANYLTEANVSMCNHLGCMPDTKRSFTGQRFSSFSINGGHMVRKEIPSVGYTMGRSSCVAWSDNKKRREAQEVPIPPSHWSFPPPALTNENN